MLIKRIHVAQKIQKWGDMLRMYNSEKYGRAIKQAEEDEDEIFTLKSLVNSKNKEPNDALLGKLRSLMFRIKATREQEHLESGRFDDQSDGLLGDRPGHE